MSLVRGSQHPECYSQSLLSQRDQVLAWLAEKVPPSRIQHILRVEQMAIDLARHYHLDQEKAAQAGLLHDLAKNFKPSQLLAIAKAHTLELTPVDEANPHLLHADVGAVIAQDQFGVQDKAVLEAIRNHTLGRAGMDLLSCVVFLADSLEPGRGNSPELEAIRQACWVNLYQAVWLTCDYTLNQLMATRSLIHPRMVLTRNWVLQQSKINPSALDVAQEAALSQV
ncbi:MAG TPA: bis(5'-nucleosyl)-tetraphosphatase (symmetrical) YqeK [Candidatus Caenarcaniphilales bacterium]